MLITLIRFLTFCIFRVIQLFECVRGVRNRFKKSLKCAPIKDETLLVPATKLAEGIRNGTIKSEDIVRTYVSRIESVNSVLNAIVDERFDVAIKEAAKVDDYIANSNLDKKELAQKYPLLGLPITIKESISVKGLSFTAGKVFPGGRKGENDADVVRKIKEAGAIVLAVTNTPELCVNLETFNNVTGVTVNPYDTRRTCSGSSGGEGALLGAGASLLGIGSDLLGSIRLPAHHCGVWGHKPSSYAVSIQGHYPACEQENVFEEVFSLGPMVRYATDLKLLLNVILEDEKRTLLQLTSPITLNNIKVYVLDLDNISYLTHKVDAEINFCIQKFSTFMAQKHGSQVKMVSFEPLKVCFESVILKILKIEYTGIYTGERAYWEMLKYLFGQSYQVFTAILPGVVQHILRYLPKTVFSEVNEQFARLRGQIQATLGNDGILVLPCHNTAAHRHGEFAGKFFDYSYTGIFNGTGLPATSCPMGLNSKKLPIGVQIVASFNNDRLCLAVAEEIEKEFGGWIPPKFAKQEVE